MLPYFTEPTEVKKRFEEDMKNNRRMTEANITQGTWFTKPLWDLCKKELIEQGISWQNLMKAFGRSSWYFVEWVEGKKSWDEALSSLKENIREIKK